MQEHELQASASQAESSAVPNNSSIASRLLSFLKHFGINMLNRLNPVTYIRSQVSKITQSWASDKRTSVFDGLCLIANVSIFISFAICLIRVLGMYASGELIFSLTDASRIQLRGFFYNNDTFSELGYFGILTHIGGVSTVIALVVAILAHYKDSALIRIFTIWSGISLVLGIVFTIATMLIPSLQEQLARRASSSITPEYAYFFAGFYALIAFAVFKLAKWETDEVKRVIGIMARCWLIYPLIIWGFLNASFVALLLFVLLILAIPSLFKSAPAAVLVGTYIRRDGTHVDHYANSDGTYKWIERD